MIKKFEAFLDERQGREYLLHKSVASKGWRLMLLALALLTLSAVSIESLGIAEDIQVYFWVASSIPLACGMIVLVSVPADQFNVEFQLEKYPEEANRLLLVICLVLLLYGGAWATVSPILTI
jgi:hypothetical protein